MTRLLPLVAVTLSLIGCSTTAIIHTTPPGANLFVSGVYVGKTPVAVTLKDGLESPAGTSAKVELAGHRTQHVMLHKDWSAGYILLDLAACLVTLGVGCYLIYFNGKTHCDEYHFPLLREERSLQAPPPATPAPPALQPNS